MLDVSGDQEELGIADAHLQQFQPVPQVVLAGVRALTGVPEDKIDGVFRKEELVGGVLDVLPGEIPDRKVDRLVVRGVQLFDVDHVHAEGFLA